jgi:hypothetical protein
VEYDQCAHVICPTRGPKCRCTKMGPLYFEAATKKYAHLCSVHARCVIHM